MPDTIAEVKPIEVITNTQHEATLPTLSGTDQEAKDRVAAGIEKGKRGREAEKQNPDNTKAVFESTITPPDYTKTQLDETAQILGTEAEAIKTIHKPLAEYLEKAREKQLTGAQLEHTDMTGVAKLLIDRGRLLEKFPDLKDAFDEPGQEAFVREFIAKDPKFQLKLSKELADIYSQAKALKESSQTEEHGQLEAQKESFEKVRDKLIEQIGETLTQRGLEDAKDRIEELIKAGVPPEDVLHSARLELGQDFSLEKYEKFDQSYDLHNEEVVLFEQQLERAQQALKAIETNPNAKNSQTLQNNVDNATNSLAKARQNRENADKSRKAHKEAYMAMNGISEGNDEEFAKKYQAYFTNKPLLDPEGPLSKTIESAARNQARIAGIEAQIKEIDNRPENKDAQAKKEALIKRLELSVDTAMVKYLEQKYQDYTSTESILMNAAIKDAEAYGKPWKKEGLEKLKQKKEAMSKFRNGKYERDSSKIGAQIRELAEKSAQGESGLKEIVAQTVGFNLNTEELRNEIASELNGQETSYEDLSAEQKAAVDSAVTQRTAEFEEIMTEQGEKYKERLFVEYNAAKGFMDKLGFGDLKLTNDQEAILNNEFASLDKKLEASGFWKTLKEKGWDGHKKRNILLLLLLLGASVSLVGVVPAAIAAGTAAKGIGSTAVNDGVLGKIS